MMDIASLGLAIDSSQAERGTLALDKIAVAARKFEDNATRMATTATSAFKTTGSSVETLAKKTEDNLVRMSGAFTKAGRDAAAIGNPLKPTLDALANDNIPDALGAATKSLDRFNIAVEAIRAFTWNNTGTSRDKGVGLDGARLEPTFYGMFPSTLTGNQHERGAYRKGQSGPRCGRILYRARGCAASQHAKRGCDYCLAEGPRARWGPRYKSAIFANRPRARTRLPRFDRGSIYRALPQTRI